MLNNYAAVAGGFDPIHSGHIKHLDAAFNKAYCEGRDLLIILTRDEQLVSKKGYCLMPFQERQFIIKRLFPSSFIIENIDGDLSCKETLKIWKPKLFLKGGNSWNKDNLPELEVCKDLEIEVVYGLGGYEKIQSSSDLVRKAMECLNSQ